MTIDSPDWSLPQTWLLAALLLFLLVVPLWLLSRQRGIGLSRTLLRTGLHLLLWLAVLGLWLQPRWTQTLPTGSVLLVADNVPAAVVQRVKDSTGIRDVLTEGSFQSQHTRVPVDTVTLMGQSFSQALLAKLARQTVRWIPYDVSNQIQQIRWQGVLRQGERQRVYGRLNLSDNSLIRLRFGQRTVDSVRLESGHQLFSLTYPVFARGRTQLTLWLNDTVLDTVRFVVRPVQPLRVRFVLDAPDFETRALADWLGQQGNAVTLTSRLSTGIGSELTLNKTTSGLPNLIVTDPANVGNPMVSKALSQGKSVLVVNLSRPDADLPAINRALGTRFSARRVPGKDTIRLTPDLTALPFHLTTDAGTLSITGYPIAVQSATERGTGNRVAVSLLTETFPLRLSGDSASYAQLWQSVLAPLRPTSQNNIQVEAPVFINQLAHLGLNNATTNPTRLRAGSDTLTTQADPVNSRSVGTFGRFAATGWLPIQDTLAVYAYPTGAALAQGLQAVGQRDQLARWVRAHHRYDQPTTASERTPRIIEKAIPGWGWLLLIGLLLTFLWLEPKLA